MTIGIALGNIKKLQLIAYALCALLFALCTNVEAQQSGKVPRIGFLIASSSSAIAPRMDAFR